MVHIQRYFIFNSSAFSYLARLPQSLMMMRCIHIYYVFCISDQVVSLVGIVFPSAVMPVVVLDERISDCSVLLAQPFTVFTK